MLGLDFPPPANRFELGPGLVLFTLLGSAHRPLLDLVETRYASAPETLRVDLLTLVASAGTARGAALLLALLEAKGWPDPLHGRFFTELSRNLPHAELLFPALMDVPDGPLLDVGDLALRALRSGTLTATRFASGASGAGVAARIGRMLAARPDVAANDPEELPNLDDQLRLALDFAGFVGFVGGRDAGPPLRATLALPELRLVLFAVMSLVRRGEEVPAALFARLGADDSLRTTLYGLLKPLGASARIPPEFRTRDAFAAADMAQWLAHPHELGLPPAELEAMAGRACSPCGASAPSPAPRGWPPSVGRTRRTRPRAP